MRGVEAMEERTRALVEAGIALSSELSLDAVLQKLVETAAALTGARYAALGVLDPAGQHLDRFLTAGIDGETRRAIGQLPAGRGILGVLIRDGVPLRLHDLSQDPRSVGFPPGHPPMRSFLGVPLALRGVAYGNLYLTEKQDGLDFSPEDEDVVGLLAAQAAVAIENARLYESATRWSRQLESLNELTNALVGEFNLDKLLEQVAARLRELIQARTVTVSLPHADGLRIKAVAGTDAGEFVGMKLPARSKTMRVLERRRSERVDSVLDDPEIDQTAARQLELNTALYVPIVVRQKAIGVIGAHDKLDPDPRFTDEDLRLAEAFAARAAVAIDLSRRVARDALERIVAAQELERRRLARELHDETGQALTSILLALRSIETAPSPERLKQTLANARDLVQATLQDVRQLAVELRPSALDDFGLAPALQHLLKGFADQTGLSVAFESTLADERLPTEIETALYRIVQEALTNIVKHARAGRISITLTSTPDSISLLIEDDGIGLDPRHGREGGLGLTGMRERVELLGGRLTIESPPTAGTTIRAQVPRP
jgi:signal transduction histidine kinase